MKRLPYISLLACFLLFAGMKGEDNAGLTIIQEMIATTTNFNNVSFDLVKNERIEDEIFTQKSFLVFKLNPLTAYIRQDFPKEGIEVLFGPKTENQLYINPNGFPWINVTLDPMGSLARKDQHHTIHEVGYNYFCNVLTSLIDKYGAEASDFIYRREDEMVNGMECYIIEFKNPHFKVVNYKVLSNENVIDIARKFNISEYMILELNDDIDDYEDVSQGQRIKIPNDYCVGMKIAVDKAKMCPASIVVKDNKGLFEKYVYTNIKVNSTLTTNTFNKENPAYNF